MLHIVRNIKRTWVNSRLYETNSVLDRPHNALNSFRPSDESQPEKILFSYNIPDLQPKEAKVHVDPSLGYCCPPCLRKTLLSFASIDKPFRRAEDYYHVARPCPWYCTKPHARISPCSRQRSSYGLGLDTPYAANQCFTIRPIVSWDKLAQYEIQLQYGVTDL
jgi:hypothetical protein